MARRPEEKYKPGELKKVKENLGQLSKEEAKRMSKILGGEIGVEKTDKNIDNKYKELNTKNKNNRKDKLISKSARSQILSVEKKSNSVIKYSYIDKIKLYYLASHPDHNIKTTKEIIKALFDLSSKQENYINPNLFDSSNYFFNKSITTFVKATRFISKSIPNKYLRRDENIFYWLISDTICSWDIESIQEEIFILKKKSPRVTLESCAPLIKLIYYPLIKLSKVNRKKDIEGTIKYLYKLSVKGLLKKDLQADRLRKSYTQALSEIDNIFVTIKYRLYPLILMFVSPKVYDYNSMFRLKGKEILNFLDLNSEELITFFDKEPSKIPIIDPEEENQSEEENISENNIIDISVHQGILLLDKMFPEAGWLNLSKNPDMYPYFQTILDLPKEISLISQNDPLQKIVILIAILKDLFYGFSNIEYGFLLNDLGKPIELDIKMDLLIKNWYLYIDDLILKNYLNLLNEYCRHLERSIDPSETEYTKRIASEIIWMKKTFIFPNISLELPQFMKPRTKIVIPELFETVKDLKTILGKMVFEIFSQKEIAIETLRNPTELSWFEIENHVSKRINTLVKETNKQLTNSYLILYTYEIVEVLNNIIQSFKQEVNISDISNFFRSEDSRGVKPIYSVSSDNIFFKVKDRKVTNPLNPEEETNTTDLITGFLGKYQLSTYLNHFIAEYNNTDDIFSIIHINIYGFKTNLVKNKLVVLSDLLKKTVQEIYSSIRIQKDIPFRTGMDNIYIILPKTKITSAVNIAKNILLNGNNKLFIGVTSYQPGMDEDQIISILENSISKQLPVPGITYYDVDKKRYIQQSS